MNDETRTAHEEQTELYTWLSSIQRRFETKEKLIQALREQNTAYIEVKAAQNNVIDELKNKLAEKTNRIFQLEEQLRIARFYDAAAGQKLEGYKKDLQTETETHLQTTKELRAAWKIAAGLALIVVIESIALSLNCP